MATATTLELPVAPAPPAPEEPLYEVVDGQRVELPPMSIYAAWIACELAFHLATFVRPRLSGTVVTEGLFILVAARGLRRRPDVAFVSAERWPLDRELPETGDWEVVPNLAVEVISPTDVFEEVMTKMREYFKVGVELVWVVEPRARQVHVYESPDRSRSLSLNDYLEGGSLLPGFRLSVADLFSRGTQALPAPPSQARPPRE